MLRISTIDTTTERRLLLEGKLMDAWVAELTRSCRNAVEGLAKRKLVIDIKNVTVISGEGEKALLALMREGAKFSCNGVLTRYVLKRLERQCQDRLRARFKPPKSSQ